MSKSSVSCLQGKQPSSHSGGHYWARNNYKHISPTPSALETHKQDCAFLLHGTKLSICLMETVQRTHDGKKPTLEQQQHN